MSQPTTRILALLELLQAHQRLSGTELAQRLGVDTRTVRRYATRLADLGIPVVAERGRYGGYRLLPGYRLPPLMLGDDEAVAVVLGLLAAERLGLTTTGPGAAAAQAKIERVLPPALRDRVTALAGSLGFTTRERRQRAPAATDTLLTLGVATRARRRVRLAYRSWSGEESEREVDPYGLVFHAGRWYLAAYDHRRGQVRTFRVDRVGRAQQAAATFEAPDDFDAGLHVTRSLAQVPYRHEVEVVLFADLAQVRAGVPPSVATLVEVDGGVLVRTRAEDLAGMARMLAGLGCDFVVRRPDELRAAVAALASRLAASAARGDAPDAFGAQPVGDTDRTRPASAGR